MPSLLVSHLEQLDFGYCLPACIEMVLAYRGIARTQVQLAQQLGMIEDLGVPAPNVSKLTSRQITVQRQTGRIEDLLFALANDIPPIMEVRTGGLSYWDTDDTYHVVVLVGLEDISGKWIATVNDPAFPKPKLLDFNDLQVAWDERDNYFTLIATKES
jgi:Peptidase_C39 like family